MASAEQYAAWIVANANKRGTPEFDTVAKAYQEAKAMMSAAPAVNVSSIDKEIAAKRAEIAQRQQEISAAKTQQAEAARYREEHPILSALRGALTATSDRGVLTSPKGLEVGLKPLQQDLATLEARRAESVKQGKVIAAPTAGRIAAETGKAVLRGPIRAVEDIASWAGAAGAPGEAVAKGVESLGERAVKGLGLEQGPEIQYSGLGQRLGAAGELLGGVAAFAPLEALGAAGKLATATRTAQVVGKGAKAVEVASMAGMGARQARETMDAYEERTGEKLDPLTRSAVQVGGSIIGTALMLPVKAVLSKAAPEISAAAGAQVTSVLARLGASQIGKSEAAAALKAIIADVNATAVGRAVTKGAVPTGLVLGGMQAGQNVLEAAYNPEKRSLTGLGAGVEEAAISGALGGASARGIVEGLQARGNAKRQATLDTYLKQKAQEQALRGADYGTFDVISRTADNKVQREAVKVVSEPDENGNVYVQRADGTRSLWPLEDLKASHAPSESIRAVPLPDTMSRQAIAERLRNSLGDFAPDEYLDSFIKKTADEVADAVVLGQPERPESYLAERERAVKAKRKISEESRIGHSLVLDEARKVLNEYTDLVTAPPEKPTPVVTNRLYNEKLLGPEYKPGDVLPKYGYRNVSSPAELEAILRDGYMLPPEGRTGKYFTMSDRETPSGGNQGAKPVLRVSSERIAFDRAVKAEDVEIWNNDTKTWEPLTGVAKEAAPKAPIEDVIQNRAQAMREENARRTEMLDRVANDPNAVDKPGAFEDMLDQSGYGKPTPHEIAHLHDAMRLAAEQETAFGLTGARVEDLLTQEQRQAGAGRANIIEDHLYDPEASPRKKIERINADLEAAGLAKLTEDEVNRYQAVADALAAYGPKGERQRALEQIVSDPNIKGEDKIDAFREAVKGEPTEEELAALAGSTAELEAQIKPAAEQGGVTPEPTAVERAPAPVRTEEIAAEAEAANQRLREAAARVEQSRAEVDRINQELEAQQAALDAEPHKGTPGARKAINAIKSLEAERAAAEEASQRAEEHPLDFILAAEAEATRQGHTDVMDFRNGADDARFGLEPFSDELLQQYKAPAEIAAYKAGLEWGRNYGQEKPTGTTKYETTVETGGEKRTIAGEGAPTVEELTGEASTSKAEAKPAAEPEDVVIMGDKPVADKAAADVARTQRKALAANWRMSKWYRNLVYHFGGAKGGDIALAKSMGLDHMPSGLSVNDKFEMLATNQNGMVREINRRFNNPITSEAERLYREGVTADDISDALQARAAVQRNEKVSRNNPDFAGYGSGFAPEEAQAILTDLKLSGKLQKMGKIIKLHDALRKHMQDLAVESGLISREKMDQFIAEEPDYTPFKGWAADGDLLLNGDLNPHADYGKPEYIRKPLGVGRKIVRKAEGRSTQAANSLFNLMADAQVMAVKAARNKPGLAMLNVLETKPLETVGIGSISEKPIEGAVTVMRDGKPYYITFEDTPAGNAFKSAFTEMADPADLNTFIRHFMKVNGLMRGVNTTFSPLFWIRAFRKDVKDMLATAYSEQSLKDSPLYQKQVTATAAKYALSPDMHRAIWSYLRDTTPTTPEGAALKQMLTEMVEAGGSAGYAFREQAQDIEARMQKAYERLDAIGSKKAVLQTKEGIHELANAIHTVNDYVDIAPRFALYRAAVEAGVRPEAAAKVALESSLNLPRRGRYGSAIDAVKWYTNAGIQSVAKKRRMLSSANGRKVLAAHMALGSALAAWNMSVAGDKDNNGKNDYLDLPAWQKAGFLIIYSPSGEHNIKIPMGFMTAFETYFGQKMTELAYGLTSSSDATAQLGSAIADVGKAAISSQLPLGRNIESIRSLDDALGLVIPDIAAPIEAVRTNKNAFGDQIFNEPFNREQAKSSVPRASTPQAYKDWASWLNSASGGHGKFAGIIDTHPETWKYLVDQYLGGVGRLFGAPGETLTKEISADESRASGTQYYDISSRMRQVKEAFGPTGKRDRDTIDWLKANRPIESNPRVRAAYNAAEKVLDRIKARETNLGKSKLPPEQKQVMADKIEADRQAAYARFLRIYNDVSTRQE